MAAAYTRWSVDNEVELVKDLQRGISIAAIAVSHNRTEGAINSRLGHIIRKMAMDGMSEVDIAKFLSVSPRRVHVSVLRGQKNELISPP